jgi:hypothetical protein
MKTKPFKQQKSKYVFAGELPTIYGAGSIVKVYQRHITDGKLRVFIAEEPFMKDKQFGIHLSIAFTDNKGNTTRYPNWDEIIHAREELLPGNKTFVMYLPPESEYVSFHDTTFHLWEHEDG